MIRNKMEKEIYDMLQGSASWNNDKGEVKNAEAREALVRTLALCRNIKPDKFYESQGYCGHLGYLHCLLNVRCALIDSLYMRACSELRDVIYLYSFTQARILNNVTMLLKEFLQDGEG